MADFPKIKPTSRRFSLGDYPTKTYRALSGKITKRNFGNKAFGHTIELGFENVKEDVVRSIIDHYNGQLGQTEGFALPVEVFAGLSSTTRGLLRSPSETLWFYAESPLIDSVYRDLSTVSVRLVAEIV
jgi:hypothetical protein